MIVTDCYCFNCSSDIPYLSEVTDPDSDDFDEPCCCYCGSTSVIQRQDEDDR